MKKNDHLHIRAVCALTTAHNPKDKTLRSIRDLAREGESCGIDLTIVVVDDGSTDGTAAAIAEDFPAVVVVPGNGGLYWAGGMRLGWHKVVRKRRYDALLVFNDDIGLLPGALRCLLDTSGELAAAGISNHAVVGALSSKLSGEPTYGGWRSRSKLNPLRLSLVCPNGRPQQVDTLNMNFALLRREAVDAVSLFPPHFSHCAADFDFGFQLNKAGGSVWLVGQSLGTCERNSYEGTHLDRTLSPLSRLMYSLGPKGEPPWQRLRYVYDHGGVLWPLTFFSPYVTALFGRKIL